MIPELYAETVELPEEPVLDEPDIVLARRLVIAHEQAKRRLAEAKHVKAAVAQAYDLRIGAAEASIAQIRGWLATYVERHGKLSLPDVGSVYVQTRRSRPRVTDTGAALAYALEHAPAAVMREPALNETAYVALCEAALVATGEILPGFEPGSETRSLVVKA